MTVASPLWSRSTAGRRRSSSAHPGSRVTMSARSSFALLHPAGIGHEDRRPECRFVVVAEQRPRELVLIERASRDHLRPRASPQLPCADIRDARRSSRCSSASGSGASSTRRSTTRSRHGWPELVGLDDEHRRRLTAAYVTTGCLSGIERREKPVESGRLWILGMPRASRARLPRRASCSPAPKLHPT